MADIVVVDDKREVAEPLIQYLELNGHAVRYADDGTTGLVLVDQQIPELIFLDIEMPQLSGPEMAYRLLIKDAGREKIPIIVVSGAADIEKIVSRIGTPYYLAKPYAFDDLDAILERALRERQFPTPMRAA